MYTLRTWNAFSCRNKKIIYQEPFGTYSIFKLVLPVSVELSEPEERLVVKCSFLMEDVGLFSFGTQ